MPYTISNPINSNLTMKTNCVRNITVLLSVCVLAGSTVSAQLREGSENTVSRFLNSITVRTKANTFVSDKEYGAFGTAGLGFPVTLIPSQFDGILFGRDVEVQFYAGSGSWSLANNPQSSLFMEILEGDVQIPVFTPSDEFCLSVSPSLGVPILGNHVSGERDWVPTWGLGLDLDLGITRWMSATAGYRWSQTVSKSFLWTNRYESVSVGLSFRLGDVVSTMQSMGHEVELSRQTVAAMRDSLSNEREQRTVDGEALRNREYKHLRDDVGQLLLEVRGLRTEVASQRSRQSSEATARFVSNAGTAQHLTGYDASRLPNVRVIRINRRLFDKGDLVEEDYLKSILAVISNYDNYVWEIAYRDSLTADFTRGSDLAGKIQDFFEIYNSKFKDRICPVHDSNLASEFELRCLGQARSRQE